MEPRRSTSGATVVQLGEYVVKLGDGEVGARVGEQAKWLHEYRGHGIVPVTILSDTAYVMPALMEWPTPIDTRELWKRLTAILEEWVWPHEPVHAGTGKYPFSDKLAQCMNRNAPMEDVTRLITLASTMQQTVEWGELPRCLTHGDPTFANTMHSEEGLVLIDPLPSTWDVPDIRAKDLGKLLQSCMGYEHEILGWDTTVPDPYWVQGLCSSDNEWRAAKFCGVLHIIRLIPYVAREGWRREWAIDTAHAIAGL